MTFSRPRFTRVRSLLGMLMLLLAACGTGDGDGDAPATPTIGATGTPTPDGSAQPPERWVGIDEGGRLVTVRTADGEVEQVLGRFDDPQDCPPPGEPAAGCRWVTNLALSPDGDHVYYETCCEPAPGTIYRVPAAGGESELVAHGAFPAVDPDGSRLAAVELQWIMVHELRRGNGQPQRLEAADAPPVALHGMAWSPDGDRLAFTRFDRTDEPGHLQWIDVSAADGLGDAETVGAPADGASWTLPSFRSDGLLAVAEQELQPPDEPSGPATVLLVDPETGGTADSFDPGAAVLSLRFDTRGELLIYVTSDGQVRWRDLAGEDTTLKSGGYLAAAW